MRRCFRVGFRRLASGGAGRVGVFVGDLVLSSGGGTAVKEVEVVVALISEYVVMFRST